MAAKKLKRSACIISALTIGILLTAGSAHAAQTVKQENNTIIIEQAAPEEPTQTEPTPKPQEKPKEEQPKKKDPTPEAKPEKPAQLVESHKYQRLKYDVFASGIHAVKANMTLDYRTAGRYAIFFSAETRGLLGQLAPWSGTFETRGWSNKDGTLVPELHRSTASWQGEEEVKTYTYDKNGGFTSLSTEYKGKKPKLEKTDEALTKDTTDALTAMILVLENITNGGNCQGTSDVFDGKRRFTMTFNHVQNVMLEKTRYNAFSGPAAECFVDVEPKGGKWYTKPRGWLSIQEQGRDRGMMPTVWMAQLVPYSVVVPVRVRVKTAYGTLFMHLTEYTTGGKTIKAGQ